MYKGSGYQLPWHCDSVPRVIKAPQNIGIYAQLFGTSVNMYYSVNSLRQRLNRCPFGDNILKCIFLNESNWVLPRTSLKFVPKVWINTIPALVQIMAWHPPGDKPLSEPMMVSLLTHICVTRPQWVSTLRRRQHRHHFPDDILKCIFLNENVCIAIEISLKFVPPGPVNNIPVLVWIMAWCQPGDKSFSQPMMVSLLMNICVTRPQWINISNLCQLSYTDLLPQQTMNFLFTYELEKDATKTHIELFIPSILITAQKCLCNNLISITVSLHRERQFAVQRFLFLNQINGLETKMDHFKTIPSQNKNRNSTQKCSGVGKTNEFLHQKWIKVDVDQNVRQLITHCLANI